MGFQTEIRRQRIVPRINKNKNRVGQANFLASPAQSVQSANARLVATIVDNILVFTALAAGFIFVAWLAKMGVTENPMETLRTKKEFGLISFVVLSLLPTMLIFGQWFLLATSGQTIGKKLLMIRIVSTSGKLPGFLQAVVLRNWLRVVFSIVPFFGLIDVLFIFSDSRRCLHDYLAATRVVSIN